MSRFDDDFAVAFQDVLFERGDVVTHRPVSGSAFDVTAVFNRTDTRNDSMLMKDDRQGRRFDNSATLDIGTTDGLVKDVNGNIVTLDDQGEFTVRGVNWSVSKLSYVNGVWHAVLTLVDRKTVRHLPGNR